MNAVLLCIVLGILTLLVVSECFERRKKYSAAFWTFIGSFSIIVILGMEFI